MTVNGRINSFSGAGIFLAGGGRVFIGPTGRIDTDSGIAILASGDTEGENSGDPVLKPNLLIGMQLDGRQVADILGNSWIINDGGETTIVVNGVTLHDGKLGVVKGAFVSQGIRDLTIREAGVRTIDRTNPDPQKWSISEPTIGVITDRDFSADDFVLTYAPRAALYEVLPGFLLRLNTPGIPRTGPREPDGWLRISGVEGSFEPATASTGASYDFNGQSIEAGFDIPMENDVTIGASFRSLQGSADVSAITGGGRIEADSIGAAFGISINRPDGFYAHGYYSFTDYKLDFASDRRGILKRGVNGRGDSLDLEAGLKWNIGGKMFITPRITATWAKTDVDNFTDRAGSQVSVVDSSRRCGTIGFIAGIEQQPLGHSGETVDLWGSLDLERTFSGVGTRVLVSGEELISVASQTRLNASFGGSWRSDGFVADMGIAAHGLGSDDNQLSAQIALKWYF